MSAIVNSNSGNLRSQSRIDVLEDKINSLQNTVISSSISIGIISKLLDLHIGKHFSDERYLEIRKLINSPDPDTRNMGGEMINEQHKKHFGV